MSESDIRNSFAGAEEYTGDEKDAGRGGKRDLQLARKACNDIGNSRRFRARYGKNLMAVQQLGRFWFNGAYWSLVDGNWQWELHAQKTAEVIWDEADALAADGVDPTEIKRLREWAVESGNSGRLMGMQMRTEAHVRRQVDELDANPWLFNLQNGTLELGTKRDPLEVRLRRHSRLDLITRISPVGYDLDAKCPLFHAFLDQVLPDPEVQRWVQEWHGYCLGGDYSEHILAAYWGEGRNGKGTLIKVVQWVLGDYAATIQFATLLEDKRRGGAEASPDLAKLVGRRAVFASEPKKGSRLDDGLVKQITGGDELSVRKLYKEPFDLKPIFKLTLQFNNKPDIRDDTHGMWSRFRLVLFPVIIPEDKIDPYLLDKLKAEGPGILNWALDGWRLWRERGFSAPQAILAATNDYRSESDRLGQFLDAATARDPQGKIKTSDVFACYKGWCSAVEERRPMSLHKFGRELTKRGFVIEERADANYRLGVKWSGKIDWDWGHEF